MDALTATELSPVEQKLRDWRPDPALPAWYNAARQQVIIQNPSLRSPEMQQQFPGATANPRKPIAANPQRSSRTLWLVGINLALFLALAVVAIARRQS